MAYVITFVAGLGIGFFLGWLFLTASGKNLEARIKALESKPAAAAAPPPVKPAA